MQLCYLCCSLCSYVPMFGETEYDPTRQFDSVGIEEQLDALGRAVDAGKVSWIYRLFQLQSISFFQHNIPLHGLKLFSLRSGMLALVMKHHMVS